MIQNHFRLAITVPNTKTTTIITAITMIIFMLVELDDGGCTTAKILYKFIYSPNPKTKMSNGTKL